MEASQQLLNAKIVGFSLCLFLLIEGVTSCSSIDTCSNYNDALKRAYSLYQSKDVQDWSFRSGKSMCSTLEVGRLCYYLTAIYHQPTSPSQDPSETFAQRRENETQALLWATACGRSDIMRYLLKHHEPDITVKDTMGWDLMTVAVSMNDDPTCLQVLYEAGLDVQGKESTVTPLREAAHRSREKCILFLLDHGADINGRSALTGETALDGALYTKEPILESSLEIDFCDPAEMAKTVHFLRQKGAKLSIELDPRRGIPFPEEIIQVIDRDCGEIEKALKP